MKQKKGSMSSVKISENIKQSGTLREIWDWAQTIIIAVIIALLIRSFLFEIILVDGNSMAPTLFDRDRVFVNKIIYLLEEPSHGDIVIFKTPEDNKSNYVKRLIGLPGDRIKIENGIVYLNGDPLHEPYVEVPAINDYMEVTVPEGAFFALGDNRNDSKDSRDFRIGFISMKNLVGKAVWRIWPLSNISPIQ
ncbi:MAG: signal peptidase I [Clostridiales bacterium]|jgi:signal peptidase I|nr:signal peptidase I [Clostridiales bacterium]